MNDPFDLQRFVDAQRDSYEQALQEAARRAKTDALDVVRIPATAWAGP